MNLLKLIQDATPGEWTLEPQQLDFSNVGGYGIPTIIKRAVVIIPEHFDSEGNDDNDEIQVRLETNAALIAASRTALPEALELIQATYRALCEIEKYFDVHHEITRRIEDFKTKWLSEG